MTTIHEKTFSLGENVFKLYLWEDELHLFVEKDGIFHALNEGEGIPPELVDDYLFICENHIDFYKGNLPTGD